MEYLSSQGILPLEDLMLLGFQPDPTKQNKNPKVEKILDNKETLGRLFLLELLRRFQFQLSDMKGRVTLQPLLELTNLVSRRFNHDINWCIAIAILATHENLVKKKLILLKVSEDEINKTEKDKKFIGLVDLLNRKIEEIERRKVSLTFYKSSALREIRNTLEHYGYSQPVTRNDVLELLKDIKKFELEIFVN